MLGAAVLAMLLIVTGCGVSEQGSGGDPKKSTTTSKPAMRAPRSLCERISLDTVEGASRLKLDPGNPSERYDYPECNWRKQGGEVSVTLRLLPKLPLSDYKDQNHEGAVELPNLGTFAYWEKDLGTVSVLTDEGIFEAAIYNYELDDDVIKESEIKMVKVVMAATKVPDTTTTTPATTAPEPTGLCARVSFETAAKYAGKSIEHGIPRGDYGPDAAEKTCIFRQKTEGTVIDMQLFDKNGFDLSVITDTVDDNSLGVLAKIQISSQVIYLDAPEGVLSIQILNFELSESQFKAGALEMAKEFLDSA